MKKIFFLLLVASLSVGALIAQPTCVKDAAYTIQNGQIPKAKLQIDKCIGQYSENADVQLMKGNVYYRYHMYEQTQLEKNPSYVVKQPDAIIQADEAFFKALQLNKDVRPINGFTPVEGQKHCAQELEIIGGGYFNKQNYDEAKKFYTASIRGYKAADNKASLGNVYYILALIDNNMIIAARENEKKAQEAGDVAKQQEFEKMQKEYDVSLLENMKQATSYRSPKSSPYEVLYERMLSGGDTVAAFKYLTDGLKYVPEKERYELYLKQINHYVLLDDTAALQKSVQDFLVKFGETPENVAKVSQTLTNAGMFDRAADMLLKASESNKDNLDITKGLAYCYFFYAIQYQSDIELYMKTRDLAKMSEVQKEQSKIQQEAYKWAKKALEIDPNDPESKEMVNQLKAVLGDVE
ncbi:hypothetical protein LJC68_01655 [Bacteroidales bacterium OttesenSCG-928-B11]|nr:hypothetical protein [Bacteroidales bacterium OttesenSCG-928-C03]MDL2311570.1 hypothetical protein [Bacteroidales bacterium OttesenSCG-928-B11]MDL2325601.1 hypothetical protein [Bacteroidales bacterium OttesenSCG-928-A14]